MAIFCDDFAALERAKAHFVLEGSGERIKDLLYQKVFNEYVVTVEFNCVHKTVLWV